MAEKRIQYFDIIKSLSIIAVIFLHYPWISDSIGSNISMLICYTAVPLFFMVNGALVFRKELNIKKFVEKIKSIIIRIFEWRIFIIIICLITKNCFF